MEDRERESCPEFCTQGGRYTNVLNAKGRTVSPRMVQPTPGNHRETRAAMHILLPERLRGVSSVSYGFYCSRNTAGLPKTHLLPLLTIIKVNRHLLISTYA